MCLVLLPSLLIVVVCIVAIVEYMYTYCRYIVDTVVKVHCTSYYYAIRRSSRVFFFQIAVQELSERYIGIMLLLLLYARLLLYRNKIDVTRVRQISEGGRNRRLSSECKY